MLSYQTIGKKEVSPNYNPQNIQQIGNYAFFSMIYKLTKEVNGDSFSDRSWRSGSSSSHAEGL